MWSFFQKYFYKVIQLIALFAIAGSFLVFYYRVYLVLQYVPEEEISVIQVKKNTLEKVMNELDERALRMEKADEREYRNVF